MLGDTTETAVENLAAFRALICRDEIFLLAHEAN